MLRKILNWAAALAMATCFEMPVHAAGLDTLPVVTPVPNDKVCGYQNPSPHAAQCSTAQSIANLAPAVTSFPIVVTFPAPTSSNGSIILTPGSPGPTAPPDGSIWVTTAGAFARVHGVTASLGVTVPSAAAGGSNTQIQYNCSGILCGVPGFTWNGSTLTFPSSLTLGVGTSLNSPNLVADTGLMQGTATVIASPECGGVSGATWLIGTDIGSWCSHVTTGGTDNIGIGTIVYNNLTSGCCNVGIGSETAKQLTTASNTVCVGFEACHAISTGGNNDAFGQDALFLEQTGTNNVAVGQGSLTNQNGANSNVGIGPASGPVITTGSTNVCVGTGACPTITTGNKNISVGTSAGYGPATGHGNVWVGGQGTTLSEQNDSVTLSDGDGNITLQYLVANGFTSFVKPIEPPSFASSAGLSGGGFTLGSTTIVGTGATVVCAASHVCDSISGEMTLTTGTGVSTTGLALTIAFALTRAAQPACLVSPFTAAAAQVANKANDASTTTLTMTSLANLVSSTAYTVSYICAGD